MFYAAAAAAAATCIHPFIHLKDDLACVFHILPLKCFPVDITINGAAANSHRSLPMKCI